MRILDLRAASHAQGTKMRPIVTDVSWSVCVRQLDTPKSCATRSSAIADGPRDALYQSKSCQLQKQVVCTTNPQQVKVMELEGYS